MSGASKRALIGRLRTLTSVKRGAAAMFEPMLARVAAQRDDPATNPDVAELLGRMHGAFGNHHGETAEHASRLTARLSELGAAHPALRIRGFELGARAWVGLSAIGGPNHGSNARNAFIFEHFEIASGSLLAELAERCGDRSTAALARGIMADDREMAATIDRNWTNVLTLNLDPGNPGPRDRGAGRAPTRSAEEDPR